MKHPILIIAAIAFVAGCGSKDVTVATGDGGKVTTDGAGNMTVTDKEGNKVDYKSGQDGWSAKTNKGEEINVNKDGGIQVKNEKGEISTMGVSEVTEAELGVPFYPGSTAIEGRDMKADADGKLTFLSARKTPDAPAKVIEFFKDKVKEATTTSSEKFASVQGKLEDGREVNIMAMADKTEGTEVQISVSGKK